MRLRQLATDDDAVSPVIGVILMVAITVILAAVIASFVLGLGGQTQTTPQASFGWDFDEDTSGGGAHDLTITHESGESIRVTELYIRGDLKSGGSFSGATWADLNGDHSTSIGGTSAVASGDSVVLGASGTGTSTGNLDPTYDLRIVWQPEEGDTSATLGEDTGPDA